MTDAATARRALVIGSTGALGSAVVERLAASGWQTVTAGRRAGAGVELDLETADWAAVAPFDGVVWAHGVNAGGGVREASDDDYARLFDVNVTLIARTLRALLAASALNPGARAVVISSVWQLTARAGKIAYVTSKAALAGLIPAIAADLDGELAINGVLPGVIDTPMTRSQLSAEQVHRFESETPGGRLATAQDVAGAVAWLLDSRGVNGQWIAVDNGWSAVRSV